MSEFIHLMLLAFVLLSVTSYYVIHLMFAKMNEGMHDALRIIFSIIIACTISFFAMPIMMLFMAPFLPLGIIMMFLSIKSLATLPRNWIHHAYSKFSHKMSLIAFSLILTFLNCILLGTTFFVLYPQA